MKFLYNIAMLAYNAALYAASPFHKKANKKVKGLNNYWTRLEESIQPTEDLIWVHAASLGELEQGWPIIKSIHQEYKRHSILLTFNSPSGFENFSNDGTVKHVFYLPTDTYENAERFISCTAPDLAFFIKYEIWLNYLTILQKAKIPTLLAPAVFRAEQIYFKKPIDRLFLPVLRNIDRILVQNEQSKLLLEEHEFSNVEIAGDSRFDRALEIAETEFADPVLEEFSALGFTVVAGSTWETGEQLLAKSLHELRDLKIILAPHEVHRKNIERIRTLFGRKHCAVYSVPPAHFRDVQVLIVDKIGILSKAYRYGKAAYIGGGFGQGIHNSIEAVAYGLPVFFGPNHKKFSEPSEMIELEIGKEVNKKDGLHAHLEGLMQNPEHLEKINTIALSYAKSKTGGSEKIMNHVKRLVYQVPEDYEFA